MKNPRIYIIGYNNSKRANRALDSIPKRYQRVLLDNGDIALKPVDGVEVYAIGLGMFTAAFNWALRDAMEHNALPIICNDDIIFENNCIPELVKEIEGGAGIACPMQVDFALPNNVIMGGTANAYPAGVHAFGVRGERFTEKRDYPWLPFCVAAINPEVIKEIGYLDSGLKMWFSDSDYSIRARAIGYRVMYVPEAVVRHEQSASVNIARKKNSTRMDEQFIMDKAYFERKYGGQILEECK